MKTIFLKNVMPAAVVVLAAAGAFATTSMQSASKQKAVTFKWGYVPNSSGQCISNPVPCDDQQSDFLCRVNGTGAVAYDKDEQNNCIAPLYRPENEEN